MSASTYLTCKLDSTHRGTTAESSITLPFDKTSLLRAATLRCELRNQQLTDSRQNRPCTYQIELAATMTRKPVKPARSRTRFLKVLAKTLLAVADLSLNSSSERLRART